MNKDKILILVNDETTIVDFRVELVNKLTEKYDVYISSPNNKRMIKIFGDSVNYIITEFKRRGKNPLSDYKLYRKYKNLFKEINPDIILTYTIKSNIYGSFAARKYKTPVIANITGLGSSIENKSLLRTLTTLLYKKSFKKVSHVFFQNEANQQFFINNNIVRNNSSLLPGSGVNLKHFKPLEFPKNDKTQITYLGRIMKDKGIDELLETIENTNDLNVAYTIVGPYEDIEYKDKISKMVSYGSLQYVENVEDVIPYINSSDAIINPSHHEGMSNILLESAASARPILASNIPGCVETFDDGITGLGFESKDTNSMVETIEKFVSMSYDERKEMGLKGRLKIEQEFDRNIVVSKYIEKIEEILKGND